jgi:glyoxylate reductase
MHSMPSVLVSRRLPEPVMTEMARRFTLIGEPQDRPMDRAELLKHVPRADALAVTLAETVDAELLDRAERLKIIAVYAVGYNNVDLAAAAARGIVVTNTPDVLTETTADLTWALILAVARGLPQAERALREGRWHGWNPTEFLGSDVHGRTLGLIGMGRIGRAVARRAGGFGMRVIYSSRHRLEAQEEAALNASEFPLSVVLETSDIVSIHTLLTPETKHLIGKTELALMQKTAFLINTARGPIMDEAALAQALAEGRLAGAGLDVYEEEPRVHPALLSLRNVVLLPHIGSATYETRIRMGMMVIENISAVLAGRDAPNRVSAN